MFNFLIGIIIIVISGFLAMYLDLRSENRLEACYAWMIGAIAGILGIFVTTLLFLYT